MVNRQIVLASRPTGEPSAENFRLVEVPVPELAEGQVLVRNHFLSLDPYMRGRMSEGRSYAEAQKLDAVMLGGRLARLLSRATTLGSRVTRFLACSAGKSLASPMAAECKKWMTASFRFRRILAWWGCLG